MRARTSALVARTYLRFHLRAQIHRGDFTEVQTHLENRERRAASPFIQFPVRADDLHVRPERYLQHGARLSAIKLLRQLQNWMLSPGLSIGRAPNGNFQLFLFDL